MRAARGRSGSRTALAAGMIGGLLAAAFALQTCPAMAQSSREAPLALDGPASARPWKRYTGWPKAHWDKFDSLAKTGMSPPAPKAPQKVDAPITGDPAKGKKLVFDRHRGGSCLACHAMGQSTASAQVGNVAPDLSQIANAGRTDEWLYNYVYDARVYNPDTVMPPWGTDGLYSPSEIRDIVAFLKTLKTPIKYKEKLDDPNQRGTPKETRDNLDPMVNPGMWVIDTAKDLWAAKGPKGAACATCHLHAETQFKTWAATMPKWEPRLKKVLGIEEFVFRHAKATTGHEWLMESKENIAMAVYLRNLANGAAIAVKLDSPEAKAAAARGKALMSRKIGQLNFACVDCHQTSALHWIRGQWLGKFHGQMDHFPTWRTSKQEIWDIRRRFQWCGVAIRANELPPDAPQYGDLEIYLTSLNNGLKLNIPGIRH
jgi:sulfur-oxidizing protein SoxA